jgi:low temperature requirement protein LtrA
MQIILSHYYIISFRKGLVEAEAMMQQISSQQLLAGSQGYLTLLFPDHFSRPLRWIVGLNTTTLDVFFVP